MAWFTGNKNVQLIQKHTDAGTTVAGSEVG